MARINVPQAERESQELKKRYGKLWDVFSQEFTKNSASYGFKGLPPERIDPILWRDYWNYFLAGMQAGCRIGQEKVNTIKSKPRFPFKKS